MELLAPLFMLAVVVFIVAGVWKTFSKCGEPGWAAIVPIYNLIVLAKCANKPGWWGLLALVPLIGVIFIFLLYLGLAERFNKGAGYAVGLFFLGFIFFPMLGFGDAQPGPAKAA